MNPHGSFKSKGENGWWPQHNPGTLLLIGDSGQVRNPH